MANNYSDERFTQVEEDKQAALSENEQIYAGMIEDADSYYQEQIDASKEWAEKQAKLQNEQTDFAIEQIEQQKEQAQKDYTKEQSAAYVDWQKQSNPYGANAEQMAAAGMQGTGYSESSKVSMYNTYQNRVATARESYNAAVLNYNNAMKEAQLQNSSALAEIAYQALQQQLELGLQGFQYKNQLILEQANKKLQIEESYYNRYQDVLAQINQENALAEQIRQFNASLAEEQRQFDASLAEEERQYAGIMSGISSSGTTKKPNANTKTNIERIESGVTSLDGRPATYSFDQDSLKEIGLDGASAAELSRLVANGEISYVQVGSKIRFIRNKPTIKQPGKGGGGKTDPVKQFYEVR